MNDLERAYAALAGKAAAYETLWNYYDGKQPLVYSAERLRQIFRSIDARFTENWCAVVVDAMLDRVSLVSFTVDGDEAAGALLNALWAATELDLDAEDAHLATLVCGEAFVIAWANDDPSTAAPNDSAADQDASVRGVQAYYNDPRLCVAFYDADQPRLLRSVAKWWVGDDGRRYLTLYYADRLEYYVSRGKAAEVSAATAFVAAEPPSAPNPFGVIPVFHLRRTRRALQSELQNVIEPQNASNKLLADMMIAAEFGAMRQRWIISQSDPGNLPNSPNANWWIPAGDGVGQQSAVGQFEQTDLGNYLDAIDRLTAAIAIISRTPKHYFFTQGGDPSGEALIALEAGLNKKCAKFIGQVTPVWRQVAAFLLRLAGRPVDPARIAPVWAEARTVQPRTQAEVREINVRAGLPLVTQLRDEGWTAVQLADLAADQQAEAASAGALGAGLLTGFERGEM